MGRCGVQWPGGRCGASNGAVRLGGRALTTLDGSELQICSDAGVARIKPESRVTIGRGHECDVVLADLRVSRRHLLVQFVPGGRWVVSDLGHASGTYRGAERVSRCTVEGMLLLRLGDPMSGPIVTFRSDTPGTRRLDGLPITITVGRAKDNDIVLPELFVSRHHAQFRQLGPDTWEVVDRGSRSGTFANGRRVTREIIASGQEVLVGHSSLVVSERGLRVAEQRCSALLEAVGASAILRSGQRILSDVSF